MGSTVNLAAALANRGHRVDLVLCRAARSFLTQVQDTVNIGELRRSPMFAAYVLADAPLAPSRCSGHTLAEDSPYFEVFSIFRRW